MRFPPPLRLLLPVSLLLVAGCQSAVLDPAGDVALQQRNLIYASTGLMLLIIVPVMLLTVIFAWRYRKNSDATYDPKFDHSTSLELVIWAAPLLIIIALGALTWSSTHLLDPFRQVRRIAANRPIPAGTKPLRVQVVSLDWKWLFIYPEQGIATVNELALPINRPVEFDITSTNMMNTFYAPTLAGMVYAMPGMQSTVHAVLNRTGDYDGYSGSYSGAGFSDMHFRLKGMDAGGFDRWVGEAKASGHALPLNAYLQLERPSEKVPAMRFAAVEPDLFGRIVNRCQHPGVPCMSAVMAHDHRTGGGSTRDMRMGSGMPPGRDAAPISGQKAKGALFKPAETAPAPNMTKPRQGGAPGAESPGNARNRDMTSTFPLSAPGTPRALRG